MITVARVLYYNSNRIILPVYLFLYTVASRYKAYKKYVYQYSTQSQNGVVGAASLRNGPMLTCQVGILFYIKNTIIILKSIWWFDLAQWIKTAVIYPPGPPGYLSPCVFTTPLQVEVEVPQVCKFILHTRSCALSEVSSMDAGGRPVYGPTATSDAFEAAMAKWVRFVSEAGIGYTAGHSRAISLTGLHPRYVFKMTSQ